MERSTYCCLLLVPLIMLPGCDSAAPPPAAAAPIPSANEPAKVADKPEPSKPAASRPARRERPAGDRAKISQLFQVPQVTRSSASYGETRQEGSTVPQIRLLGFSLLDGVQRALIEVKGQVLQVEQGDVIDGAEVVAIDADGVSFQFLGSRWTELLFEKQQDRPVVVARAAAAGVAPASDSPASPAATTEPSPSPIN